MAYFKDNAITDSGRLLLADVQANGGEFDATRLVIGSGNIPAGKTPATLTAVVDPVVSLEVTKKERTPDGKAIFGGYYSNKDVTTPFYFREFALYARAIFRDAAGAIVRTGDEVLYSYGNAGDTADLIPAYSTSTVIEKSLDLVSWIGNNTQINLEVTSGVYASAQEVADLRVVIEFHEDALAHLNVKTYSALEQLGVDNSDMNATDITANMSILINAMPTASRLVVQGSYSTDALAASVVERLKVDAGIPVEDYSITLDFTVGEDKSFSTEVLVTLTHKLPFNYDTYSAVYTNGILSKFSRNRSTEYFWNLTAENTGHASLLSYMASRYAEHSVLFAHVAGFNDLPSGITSGQGIINLTGGLLTVVLYTLSGLYYRRTDLTTEWTSDWVYFAEVNNGVLQFDGELKARNATTQRIARAAANNNTAQEVDFTNHYNSSNYQGIRIKKENSDLSDALNFVRMVNGDFTSYPIYHTGNIPEKSYTATVTAVWSQNGDYYYQDIAVPGIVATDTPVVDIQTGDDNALNVQYSKNIAKVFRITTDASKIRVWATEAINTEFPIVLKVVR